MVEHAVDLRENLSRSRDKQVGLRWPVAVDEFLDRLVMIIENEGERTNRKELIGAIIATTASDGALLAQALRRYRTMTVADCLPEIAGDSTVVHLSTRKPGPRPR